MSVRYGKALGASYMLCDLKRCAAMPTMHALASNGPEYQLAPFSEAPITRQYLNCQMEACTHL